MLDFTDAPYRFFPAKPSPTIAWLCRQVNRGLILPGPRHRIREIRIGGHTPELNALRQQRARLIFVANHSTHSDPQVLTEVQRRCRVSSQYMAAYDVFLRGRFSAWIMQRTGAFSVDRDGADRKAMTAATDVVSAGRHALTIFPEGNVHFTNDRVGAFLDGASFIALKAQKALGAEIPVYVIPVALKFTHLTDVRPAVLETLSGVARAVGTNIDPSSPAAEELARIGLVLLARNLRHRGYLKADESLDGTDLFDAIGNSASRIIEGLETKMDLKAKPSESLAARAGRIRSGIHQVLTDPEREIDHRAAAAWGDEAILALRILAYETPYVRENPTLDRFAETVEKLKEDLYSRAIRPFGDRRVLVHIGAPIRSSDRLEAFQTKARPAIVALTHDLRAAVQSGLDTVNTNNDAIGATPF